MRSVKKFRSYLKTLLIGRTDSAVAATKYATTKKGNKFLKKYNNSSGRIGIYHNQAHSAIAVLYILYILSMGMQDFIQTKLDCSHS